MTFLSAFDRAFRVSLSALCIALLLVMLFAILGQVAARYIFNAPLSWSEELARYSMVWLAMLGSGLAMRENQHIIVGNLVPVSEANRHLVLKAMTVVSVVVIGVFAYFSWQLVSRTGMQRTAALGLPMSWIYLSLTVGSVLMLVGLFLSAKFPPEQPADEIPELPTT